MVKGISPGVMVNNTMVQIPKDKLGSYVEDKKEGYGEFIWPNGS
jgi:hypothetical protein